MDRRRFLLTSLAGALAPSLAAVAQQPKVYRIGWLGNFPPTPTMAPIMVGAFTDGLREHGYVEGTNLKIEFRWGQGLNETMA
jgi:putative ABC transport system substrate-binding protein